MSGSVSEGQTPASGGFVERGLGGMAEQADAGHAGLGQRQSGAAEGAFGREPADMPVGAAAAGAPVHLARMVEHEQPAAGGIESGHGPPHRLLPRLAAATSCDESCFSMDELNQR